MSESPVPDVPVLVEMGGGVAEITLNRPAKMNALTPEMLVRLDQAWAQISKDPEIRVVILTGAGERAFCAGADLGRLTPLLTRARQAEDEWDEALLADPLLLNRALLRGTEMITPVIAALRGQVVGGGMELMLACDLRVAAEDCRFGLMEVKRGLIPAAGGIARLSRQVAQAQAAEILLVGDRIPAAQALAMGLVNRVVPADEVMATARALAGRMAENGPLALRKAKQVMLESSGRSLADGFAAEDEAIKVVLRSADAREGLPRLHREAPAPLHRRLTRSRLSSRPECLRQLACSLLSEGRWLPWDMPTSSALPQSSSACARMAVAPTSGTGIIIVLTLPMLFREAPRDHTSPCSPTIRRSWIAVSPDARIWIGRGRDALSSAISSSARSALLRLCCFEIKTLEILVPFSIVIS